MPTFPFRRLVSLGLLLLCGCSQAPADLKVFPVSGRVLIDGAAPVRAEVRLRPVVKLEDPQKRSIEPYAVVAADGSFKVGTYRGDDGAPPGKYLVTIVWPEITIDGGEEVIGEDRLRGRFADYQTPIATVDVLPGDNRIPDLQLKTQ